MTDKERLEEIKQDVKMTRKDLAVSPSNEMTLHMGVMLNSMDYLIERVQELEDIIYQDARQDVIEGLYEENKRYRETIKSVRSEIKYALYSNKSEDVKRHYLQNAEREATEALEELE